MKSRFFILGISIPMFLLIVCTILFMSTDWDIQLQYLFFSEDANWYLSDYFLYPELDYISGAVGFIVVLGALIVFSLSYWMPKLKVWRKISVFLILTFTLTNILVINIFLKENWGRPNPSEIKAFGGDNQFHYVWQKSEQKNFNSFPCGQSSIAFFVATSYLAMRRKKIKRLGRFLLVFGFILGVLTGLSRMAAGLQFASDIAWSAAIVWFSAVILSKFMKLDEVSNTQLEKPAGNSRIGKISTAFGKLSPVLLLIVILATPYICTKKIQKSIDELKEIGMKVLSVQVENGTLDLRKGNSFRMKSNIAGFGFPSSKVQTRWLTGDTSIYAMEKKGWFTERICNSDIEFPFLEDQTYELNVDNGDIYFDVPVGVMTSELKIFVKEGDVKLNIPAGAKYFLDYSVPHMKNELSSSYKFYKNKVYTQGDTGLRIKVVINKGTLHLDDLS